MPVKPKILAAVAAVIALVAAAVTATTAEARTPIYRSCVNMWRAYPTGVAKPGARDRTSGRPVTVAYVSASLYRSNRHLDRDGDGIACERHPITAPAPKVPVTATTTSATRSPVTHDSAPWVTAVHASPTTITIIWTAVPGASWYRLAWVEYPGGRAWVGEPPAFTLYRSGPVTLTGLRPNHTYMIYVTPVRDEWEGADGVTQASTTGP